MSRALFDKWHRMVMKRDMKALNDFLAPGNKWPQKKKTSSNPPLALDIQFSSPVVRQTYHGKKMAMLLLSNVVEVFGDSFTYHRKWYNENGMVLEFTSTVDGKEIHGVDLIEFNKDEKIVRMEVMVRPYSGMMTLKKNMAERLEKYAASKSKL
jgi:hypothetical protein